MRVLASSPRSRGSHSHGRQCEREARRFEDELWLFELELLVLERCDVCFACPLALSCRAFFRVAADDFRAEGGFTFTPARRAFDSPMATACFFDATLCLPLRAWCISSRTNSPACVEPDFPSFWAR